MPNNFRKTGAFYISPDGNDANNGLTADTPKRTFADYGASTTVIGAGEYKGAFVFQGTQTLSNDGFVKINLTANFVILSNSSITFPENSLIDGNGFALNIIASYTIHIKVVLKNLQLFPQTIGVVTLTSCSAINLSGTGTMAFYFKGTSFFNSNIVVAPYFSPFYEQSVIFNDCYLDAASVFAIPTPFFNPATQFKNNNFRGQLIVAGTPYELKKEKDGNAINPNPGVLDLVTIDPTVYDRGNFSQDPLFLNLSKGDYWAVSPASPNLFADSTGIGNIGGVFAAVNTQATDPAFASPAANNGTADLAGGIIWASLPGTRLSQPIQIATTEGKPLKKGIIAALMNFNNLDLIGSAGNKDVTATTNYSPGTAGANPQRVKTIKMRIKSTLPAPVNAASYDNNGYITPGDFFDFEVLGNNTDFLVDPSGKGTGDPLFNSAGAAYISPVWVQILLTMQEGL